MNLVEVKRDDKEIYNRFVASTETGSFLQSWEWGEWQSALGRTVYRFKIVDTSEVQIGSIQLIKMPLPLGKYYLYAPYGPVIHTKSEIRISNFETIFKGLKSKFSDCLFFRFEFKIFSDFGFRASNLNLKKSLNIQPGKTLIIDLSKPEDQLLAQMHHKTRYNIRLAQKHGVEIKDEFDVSIGHGLFAKEAVNLIVETSRRQGYKGYGAEYYQRLIDHFTMDNHQESPPPSLPHREGGIERVKLHIYKAIYNNQLLASAIMIDFGKTRTFLFGGSSDESKNVMAPYLMHWQAMLDAKAAGLLEYDFWGVETAKGDTPGFVRFKLGFAPQLGLGSSTHSTGSGSATGIKEYAGAYDLVINNFGYKLYAIFRKIKRLM